MKKLVFIFLFSLFFISNSNAACDDPLTEGVDYSNCRFSDAQDLQGSYFQILIYLLQVSFRLIWTKA